jgi:hypothetical protein
MSLSDLELQYDQVPAVLPVIQRKYSNSALAFSIPLVNKGERDKGIKKKTKKG